jgi:hypothetical protein
MDMHTGRDFLKRRGPLRMKLPYFMAQEEEQKRREEEDRARAEVMYRHAYSQGVSKSGDRCDSDPNSVANDINVFDLCKRNTTNHALYVSSWQWTSRLLTSTLHSRAIALASSTAAH